MSALTILESRLSAAWGDIRTDAQADLRQALADAKAELAAAKTDAEQLRAQAGQDGGQIKAEVVSQVKPLLTQFAGAVKVAVETAEPGVQKNVSGLLETLLGDVAKAAGLASL
jgi:F0F1-type ATP synthase membrane subunit b/b'